MKLFGVLLTCLAGLSLAFSGDLKAGQVCYQGSCNFPSLDAAEVALQADPIYGGQFRKVRSDIIAVTSTSATTEIIYKVRDQPPATYYGAGYIMGGKGVRDTGCAPSETDPNWCASEDEVTAHVIADIKARASGCDFRNEAFSGSHAAPFVQASSISFREGGDGRLTGYSAPKGRLWSYEVHCPGWSSPNYAYRVQGISKEVRFQCARGYFPKRGYAPGHLPAGAPSSLLLDPERLCYSEQVRKIQVTVDQVCSAGTKNPCHPATGDKSRSESDFEFAGLRFTRTYHSRGQLVGAFGVAPGWTHTFGDKVKCSSPPTLITSSGNFEAFKSVGGDVYRSETSDKVIEKLPNYLCRLTDGNRVKIFSSSTGYLLSMQVAGMPSLSVSLVYGDVGRPVQLLDGQGRSVFFNYRNGLLSEAQLPDGRKIGYGYDVNDNLTSVDYGNGQIKRYHYREDGLATAEQVNNLTGITSEDGKRYASFGYDALDRVTSSRLHSGTGFVEQTTLDYLTADTVKVKTDGEGDRLFTFQPGMYRRELSVSDAAGSTQSSYFPDGRLKSRTDKRGVVTQYEYTPTYQSAATVAVGTPEARRTLTVRDSAQRVTRSESWKVGAAAASEIATYSYDAAGRRTAACAHDPAIASAVSYVCGSAGNAPLGVRQSRSTYCEQADVDVGTCPLLGQVTKVDGPRTDVSDISSYTYYPADDTACATAPTTCAYRKGDLKTVTNALGQTTETLRYDGAGRVLSVKDANSLVTDLEYHPRGWLVARKTRGTDGGSEADDVITRIDYSPTGLVEKTTLPDGSVTRFFYDDAHRLTAIEDAEGNRIRYTLDNAGNRTKEETVGSNGSVLRSLSRVVNQLGQIDAQLDAYDNAVTYTYDAGSNVDKVTDDFNRVSDNDYDPLNRLRKTLQDVGGINASTEFQYDALDNLTQVKDPKGLLTQYEYDGLGDLKTLTSPDTGITRYSYDSAGNRASQTDARNVVSHYGYDALNRLTGVNYPASSASAVAYRYDAATASCLADERFSVGRLAQIHDPAGETHYCYDRFGNLVRKVQISNGVTHTLRYAYTRGGQLSAITYPDGSVVDYQRDALGRTTEVGVSVAGAPRQVLLKEASYYPFGPVAEWVYGNGRLFQRTLNQNYQPGIVQDGFSGGLSLGYEFDAVGNLKTLRSGDQAEPPLRHFGYDGLNRLSEARDGDNGLLQSYAYDATGNRTIANDRGVLTPYVYDDSSHRLTNVGAQARSYLANGTTASIGGSALEFASDSAGRIESVSRNNEVAMNYRYNGKGELVHRYLGTDNTYFLYDEAGQWLGQYDNAGAATQQIVWLDNLPIGIIASGKLYYIEADHLGTPRVVLDPQRDKTVWRWDLTGEAFGNTAPNQDPDGDGAAFVLDMRFPGQRYEAAMGMNYNYFRDYDPSTGRYVESDPIGLGGGVATFSYVGGQPFTWKDSLGLKPGECYASADDAAANALSDIIDESIRQGREYAGRIYRTPYGWYSYTKPIIGTPTSSTPGPMVPGAVSVYHTHGAYKPNYTNEEPSSPDWNNGNGLPPRYLGTTSGRFLRYKSNGQVHELTDTPPSCGNCSVDRQSGIGFRILDAIKWYGP